MLLDSNIVIYAFDPGRGKVLEWLRGREILVSALTRIEVLGYWRLSEQEFDRFHRFFEMVTVLEVSREIADRAVALRRQRKMGLADAVIAATALLHGNPLATHNRRDFEWVEGLQVFDPAEESPA